MAKVKILVVEDEYSVAEVIQDMLINFEYDVPNVVSSGEEAIEETKKIRPDLVLMDIKLKGKMDGIEAANQIRDRYNIPVIYLTGHAEEDFLQRAKITGPFGYMLKPFKAEELQTTIKMAIYKHKTENELKSWVFTTLRCVGDGVITIDKKGIIKFLNPVAEALTGWKDGSALGKDLTRVFKIKDKETFNSAIEALLKGDIDSLEKDTVLISKEKTEIFIDLNAKPIRNDEGVTSGFVFIFRDITERKQAESELYERLRELENFQRVTVGRELRMIELKEKIKDLERQLKLK
ncbi:MAG: response regulator [Candidatus Marinimicrobia bacterium]|nr:response regulator [bacterium]MCG2717133.1 response regulator [Candidatus Neomarinimicrobiota bacterium]